MLTLQRLLRRRPKWNSDMAHIFWYMMDEHIRFWCQHAIGYFHGFHEIFLEYVNITFKFWVYDATELSTKAR